MHDQEVNGRFVCVKVLQRGKGAVSGYKQEAPEQAEMQVHP